MKRVRELDGAAVSEMRSGLPRREYLIQCGKAEAYAEISREVNEIASDWLAGDDGPSQD